ncbi:MAG: MMPL family transporter [Thermodesulfobacteriota bacterium]|nr:MMPL family transporter [Thermodesulfobacteriota bacterium]
MTSQSNHTSNNGKSVERMHQWFQMIGAWAYTHRIIVFCLCIAGLGIFGWFAYSVRYDNSFRAYFDDQDPTYRQFEAFRDEFGSDEISYILYTAPQVEHGIWNLEIMRKISNLTEQLSRDVPFAGQVTSLANAEFVEGVEGELLVYEILEDFPRSQADLLDLKEKILSKPIYLDGLVSRDGEYGAIIVEMTRASVDPLDKIRFDPAKGNQLNNLYPQITFDRIEAFLNQPAYDDIQFYHTGDVAMNATYNRISQSETRRLAIIAFLVIGGVLLIFFRNVVGVVGPMVIVWCAIMVAAGFVGLIGWDFDLMVIMLPAILVAVGVADSVHLLSEFKIYHDAYGDRKYAVQKTLYYVGVPCLFTTLTTMAGFGSMSVSSIKAIQHFAIYSSVGVGAAFLLSMTLLVVFLSFGRRHAPHAGKTTDRRETKLQNTMGSVARFNVAYRWWILAVFAALFVFAAVGMTRLKVDSSFLSEFSKKAEIRQVTEHVDSIMGGATSVSYVFDSGEPDGVTDPLFLKQVKALQEKARQQDVVMKTYSIVDMIKDINKEFHDGDPAYYRIPETKQLAAQLLLVYEMSGGDELGDYLSGDFKKARVELRCKVVATSRYKALSQTLNDYVTTDPLFQQYPTPHFAGMGTLWLKLMDYIVDSQIIGFAVAFSVIAVMMCIVLGSVPVGLLSMIPNLLPVMVTLGAMGWAGIPLDYVKLLIACVAIGIAVDDTVHMIVRYRQEFSHCGSYENALFASLKGVGRALFITSVVLVAGFLVNLFSIMQTMVDFGILVACTIAIALLADFLLLPALVLVTKPFGPEVSSGDSINKDSG